MPGSRLTGQDRRQIAAGLVAGLGYAEIARRLERPTSTITREIARNGGPGDYRADRAERATRRRARRHKPAPSRSTETPPAIAYGRDPEALRDLEEQATELMIGTGLPRMAARVLACLHLTDTGSLTAAELIHRLWVSPASISKAVGYLEGLALLRRDRDPRRRRDRYVLDDDVWSRSWAASIRSNERWAALARTATDVLGAATPAGTRMDGVHRFFESLHDDMTGAGARLSAGDALTALAALVHAASPLTTGELAAALDWPPDRVGKALRHAEGFPDVAGPVALRRIETGAWTATARLTLLSPAQREALNRAGA